MDLSLYQASHLLRPLLLSLPFSVMPSVFFGFIAGTVVPVSLDIKSEAIYNNRNINRGLIFIYHAFARMPSLSGQPLFCQHVL